MKSAIATFALLALAAPAIAQVQVDGYTRRDGTYVAPHYRSSPDSSRFNNYSAQGNVNPYTGQVGHVNPYATPSYPSTTPAPRVGDQIYSTTSARPGYRGSW